MMKCALEAISQSSPETKLIAVTILTSLDNDDLSMMGIDISVKNLVSNLAKLAKETGLSGVVCSSEEIKMVRETCGKNFRIIVPGIRPEGSDKDDQKRVMTPKEAIILGADHLVIGRPITESKTLKILS